MAVSPSRSSESGSLSSSDASDSEWESEWDESSSESECCARVREYESRFLAAVARASREPFDLAERLEARDSDLVV